MPSLHPSDPELRRWYRSFRRKYFGNNLPDAKDVEIYYDDMPGLQADCATEDDAPEMDDYRIRIHATWREHPEIAKLWLLHEMNHLDLLPYEKHGKRFQAGMVRLASAGAFKLLW